jgi:hypothetical protein
MFFDFEARAPAIRFEQNVQAIREASLFRLYIIFMIDFLQLEPLVFWYETIYLK